MQSAKCSIPLGGRGWAMGEGEGISIGRGSGKGGEVGGVGEGFLGLRGSRGGFLARRRIDRVNYYFYYFLGKDNA